MHDDLEFDEDYLDYLSTDIYEDIETTTKKIKSKGLTYEQNDDETTEQYIIRLLDIINSLEQANEQLTSLLVNSNDVD